jgi:hypothetical protein
MTFSDDKYCTAEEGYAIHQSVKNSINGKFDIQKYGVCPKKFIKQYNTADAGIQLAFRNVVKHKQTERRLVLYFASNIVRNLGWMYDYLDSNYIQLRKFNSSENFLKDEFSQLLSNHGVADIFSSKALTLVSNGGISRELFSTLLIGTDLDEILLKSNQSYIWKIMRHSNLAYSKFISHCNNQNQLVSTLENCLN